MILLFSVAGVLLLDGGGSDPAIGAAFGKLAGGRDGRVMLVPTALPDSALNIANLNAMPQTARSYFGVTKVSV